MTSKHIQTQLRCSLSVAKAIRLLTSDNHTPEYVLEVADVMLNTSGVEYISDKRDSYRDTFGLSYCNTGDTYTPTLLYDHAKQKWYCCAWGDIVERESKRFE